MIAIEVKEATAREISGNSKGTNKPYSFGVQTIWAHVVEKDGKPSAYPIKTEVMLDNGKAPYPVGQYVLDPSSVYVNRNGRLDLSVRLMPRKVAA